MRAGGRILMIFGVVLGMIAAAATFFVLRNSPVAAEGAETAAVPTQPVIVAFQPIEPWQEIPPDAIGIREYPMPLPADAVVDQMQVTDELTGESTTLSGMEFVQGKISNTRIYPGQVLVSTQLIDKALEEQRLGVGSTASYIVPDGKVAIAIPVDQLSSVAGALKEGDRVDVMATMLLPDPNDPESEGISVTQFFLQKVPVLRVGPWVVTDEANPEGGIVTVIVDPQQALELKRIREGARFDFVLRSITDESDFTTTPVDDQYLIEEYDVQP
jgi:pilus assembly protein CpaB